MSTISFVIPAHNEQENILLLVGKCEEVFGKTNLGIEYIFVDDGSTDDTYTNIRRIAASRPRIMPESHKVIGLRLARNFGKDAAVWAGLEASRGDVVCVMDADMQHDPAQILEMLKVLREDRLVDCVAAYQKDRNETVFAKATRKVLAGISKRAGEPAIGEYEVDCCVMRRAMVNGILRMPEYHKSLFNLFSWTGYKTVYVPYTPGVRVHGEDEAPRATMGSTLRKNMDLSSSLIRFMAHTSLALSIISFLVLIANIILRIVSTAPIPGHLPIMAAILVFAMVVFLFLGIIGEYVARVFKRSQNLPVYVLRGRVRSK